MALGSALATPFAIISEDRIADTIKDSDVHSQFPAETLDRFVSQVMVNFLATGAAPYLGEWASEEAGVLLSSAAVRSASTKIWLGIADTSGRTIGDHGIRTCVVVDLLFVFNVENSPVLLLQRLSDYA
jgi:hypothetical protein